MRIDRGGSGGNEEEDSDVWEDRSGVVKGDGEIEGGGRNDNVAVGSMARTSSCRWREIMVERWTLVVGAADYDDSSSCCGKDGRG